MLYTETQISLLMVYKRLNFADWRFDFLSLLSLKRDSFYGVTRYVHTTACKREYTLAVFSNCMSLNVQIITLISQFIKT